MFCAETENGATLQLIQWLKAAVVPGVKQVGKFARGVAAKFNEVINGVRYGITLAGWNRPMQASDESAASAADCSI